MKTKPVSHEQAEARLHDLFRHIHVPLVAWDGKQNITILNEACAGMAGRSVDEMIGQPLETLFPEEQRVKALQTIERAAKRKKPVAIELLHSNGGVRSGIWTSSIIDADEGGRAIATIASIEDITERKRLEAQLRQARKTEVIGILVGGIANDFNNALQAISGYIQLLMMRKTAGDPDLDYLSQIDCQIQRAAHLIGQLLVFGRRAESRMVSVDLSREIRRIEETIRGTIPSTVSMDMRLSHDLRPINVDPAQIRHIIINLLTNARDTMPDGGSICIETVNRDLDEKFCRFRPDAFPGAYVLLSVSDTGCGMDAETLEHVFEPFNRGLRNELGLAVVYGIVKNHNGYVTCRSEPGEGTAFDLYFPVLEGVDTAETAEEELGGEQGLQRGTETILLVDDERPILDAASDILNQYGYRTVTAETGEKAVEIYERERDGIDIVILDVVMPGMGGHRCLEELLRINPKVKVVISTGYASFERVRDMLGVGAFGIISKPYSLVDMLKKVRDILDT